MRFDDIVQKEIALYNARLLRKKFIPIEKIATNPSFYGFPRLSPRQSNARQNDFINDQKKIVAVICGNRSGKTESAVVKALNLCLKRKIKGNFWMLSESFDAQRLGIQEKIKDYLKPEDIKNITMIKNGVYGSITLQNDVFIEFKSYEQGRAKLQSAKLIGALFDEEPPEDIYDEVYTRTIDEKGQCVLAFTPLKGMTWSYQKIYNNKSNMISVYNWGMADNPFIDIEEIEGLRRNLSPKKAKMRLYGEYQGAERAIYENFYRQIHVKPNLYNNTMPVDVSIDWGINITAVIFMQGFKGLKTNIETGIQKMIDEHYVIDAVELSGFSYPQVINYILSKGYWIENWYCDPAGRARSQSSKSGMSLLDMIKREFGISFQYITKLGLEESIDIVSTYFKNDKGEARLFIQEGIKLNSVGDTLEMRIENYVRDENTGQPVKDGVNDHAMDALRYCLLNRIRGAHKVFSQT